MIPRPVYSANLDLCQKYSTVNGSIVECCHKIVNGEVYKPDIKLDLSDSSLMNMRHLEFMQSDIILKTIEGLVLNTIPALGYDPFWDVQVISPFNDRDSLSCKNLNLTLQKSLNTNPEIILKNGNVSPYKVGDKVVNTKNGTATRSHQRSGLRSGLH